METVIQWLAVHGVQGGIGPLHHIPWLAIDLRVETHILLFSVATDWHDYTGSQGEFHWELRGVLS